MMGFYDARCMVSGVSLKGTDAALILLEQAGDAYRPIALAITGNYNRLGCIDGIDEDDNTDLILEYFLAGLRSGEFVAVEYPQENGFTPIEGIENLLNCFERNINDFPTSAVLGGRPIVFALICRAVWTALARSGPTSEAAPEQLFAQLFNSVPVAEEMYREKLSGVTRHLRELSAVADFMGRSGLVWRQADDVSQHYREEIRQYLDEARQSFRDSPVILDALKDYQDEVSDLLTDD
jgi:hypothetical protein